MEPQTHKFTLLDRDGRPHEYVVTPTPAKRAYKFVVKVTSRAASSVAGLLSGDLPGLFRSIQKDGLSADIGNLLTGESVSRNIEHISEIIAETDPLELFEFTWRDGKRLALEHEFDAAFSRNYGELLEAQIAVGNYNDFLGYALGYLRKKLKEMEAKKQAKQPEQEPEKSETFIVR